MEFGTTVAHEALLVETQKFKGYSLPSATHNKRSAHPGNDCVQQIQNLCRCRYLVEL